MSANSIEFDQPVSIVPVNDKTAFHVRLRWINKGRTIKALVKELTEEIHNVAIAEAQKRAPGLRLWSKRDTSTGLRSLLVAIPSEVWNEFAANAMLPSVASLKDASDADFYTGMVHAMHAANQVGAYVLIRNGVRYSLLDLIQKTPDQHVLTFHSGKITVNVWGEAAQVPPGTTIH